MQFLLVHSGLSLIIYVTIWYGGDIMQKGISA